MGKDLELRFCERSDSIVLLDQYSWIAVLRLNGFLGQDHVQSVTVKLSYKPLEDSLAFNDFKNHHWSGKNTDCLAYFRLKSDCIDQEAPEGNLLRKYCQE